MKMIKYVHTMFLITYQIIPFCMPTDPNREGGGGGGGGGGGFFFFKKGLFFFFFFNLALVVVLCFFFPQDPLDFY